MEKITGISLSKLRVAGYAGFLRSVLDSVRAVTGMTTNVKFLALVDQLSAEITVLQEVIRRQQALLLTPEIEAADKLRDNTFMQLKHLVTAATYSSVAEEKLAGDKLTIVMKPYASDYRDQLAEETEDLRGLLTQLGTDELFEYQETLLLGAVVQRLRQQNNAFDILYKQRGQDRLATRGAGVSTVEQRKVTDELYRQLVEYLNNIVGAIDMGIDAGFDAEKLTQLTGEINALIEQYKLNIDNQNKKSKEDEETEDTNQQ